MKEIASKNISSITVMDLINCGLIEEGDIAEAKYVNNYELTISEESMEKFTQECSQKMELLKWMTKNLAILLVFGTTFPRLIRADGST